MIYYIIYILLYTMLASFTIFCDLISSGVGAKTGTGHGLSLADLVGLGLFILATAEGSRCLGEVG